MASVARLELSRWLHMGHSRLATPSPSRARAGKGMNGGGLGVMTGSPLHGRRTALRQVPPAFPQGRFSEDISAFVNWAACRWGKTNTVVNRGRKFKIREPRQAVALTTPGRSPAAWRSRLGGGENGLDRAIDATLHSSARRLGSSESPWLYWRYRARRGQAHGLHER